MLHSRAVDVAAEHPPYLACFDGHDLGPDFPRGDGRVGDDHPRVVVQSAEDRPVRPAAHVQRSASRVGDDALAIAAAADDYDFSSSGGGRFLVASSPVQDLLLSAKHLFGAANRMRSAMGRAWRRHPLQTATPVKFLDILRGSLFQFQHFFVGYIPKQLESCLLEWRPFRLDRSAT